MDHLLNLQDKAVLSDLSEAILIVAKDGTIIELAGAFESIFGYPREGLLGQNIDCLLPEASCTELGLYLQQEPGGKHQPTLWLQIQAKHHADHEVTVQLELNEITPGKDSYCLIQVRDRSQLVSTSNIVDRLGRILDASWEEVYVFEAENLNFIQVSQGAQRNLGYSRSEMMQLTPHDIKPQYSEAEFKLMLTPLLDGSENSLAFNAVHRRKDGTDYVVEIRLQYGQNETPPVFVALVKDITEQQRILRRLQESEQRLSLHVQQTPLGVIDWNLDFEVMEWNPAAERIFGFSGKRHWGGMRRA